MKINLLVSTFTSVLIVLVTLTILNSTQGQQETIAKVHYEDLVPIFSDRCIMCHSGQFAPLGLQLDSLENLLKGSQNGAIVQVNNTENSEIIRRLKGISQPRMPLTGPPYLSDEEINLFETWITTGLTEDIASIAAKEGKPSEVKQVAETSVIEAASTTADQETNFEQPNTSQEESVHANAVLPDTSSTINNASAIETESSKVTYSDVEPIFMQRCVKCHSNNGLMGNAPEGYLLDSYENILDSTDRLRVVAGYPMTSELFRRISGISVPRMPFDGPPYLNENEIALIEQWIAQGAKNKDGIQKTPPIGAKLRLQGTLNAEQELDGTPLKISSSTRIDKNPRIGNYVEVRGVLNIGGVVDVERLRKK